MTEWLIFSPCITLFENQNAYFTNWKYIHGLASSRHQLKSLNDIKQILLYIAYKRMARIRDRDSFPVNNFLSTDTLRIPRPHSHVCIKTSSLKNRLVNRFSCMLKGIVGARLVIISSRMMQRYWLILLSNFSSAKNDADTWKDWSRLPASHFSVVTWWSWKYIGYHQRRRIWPRDLIIAFYHFIVQQKDTFVPITCWKLLWLIHKDQAFTSFQRLPS